MSIPSTTSQALWLDPFRPLAAANRDRLEAAGLVVASVSTLEALRSSLHAPGSNVALVVVGLGADTALLRDVQSIVQRPGRALPIVCRTERRQLELAVQALHCGTCHVVAADDWSEPAWRQTLERATQAGAVLARPTRTQCADNTPGLTALPVKNGNEAVQSVVYVDPVSRNLLALAQRVALAPVAVLVEGLPVRAKKCWPAFCTNPRPPQTGPLSTVSLL